MNISLKPPPLPEDNFKPVVNPMDALLPLNKDTAMIFSSSAKTMQLYLFV